MSIGDWKDPQKLHAIMSQKIYRIELWNPDSKLTFLNGTSSSSQYNNLSSADQFPVLTENNFAKIFGCLISGINIVAAPPLLSFIIWFERYGNDNKRTLINRLVLMICLTIIVFLLSAQPLEIVRFTYGPLPDAVCCYQNIVKSIVFFNIFLFLGPIL